MCHHDAGQDLHHGVAAGDPQRDVAIDARRGLDLEEGRLHHLGVGAVEALVGALVERDLLAAVESVDDVEGLGLRAQGQGGDGGKGGDQRLHGDPFRR